MKWSTRVWSLQSTSIAVIVSVLTIGLPTDASAAACESTVQISEGLVAVGTIVVNEGSIKAAVVLHNSSAEAVTVYFNNSEKISVTIFDTSGAAVAEFPSGAFLMSLSKDVIPAGSSKRYEVMRNAAGLPVGKYSVSLVLTSHPALRFPSMPLELP